jgi:hypothetical protein
VLLRWCDRRARARGFLAIIFYFVPKRAERPIYFYDLILRSALARVWKDGRTHGICDSEGRICL